MAEINLNKDIEQFAHKVLIDQETEKSPEMVEAISKLLNTYYGYR